MIRVLFLFIFIISCVTGNSQSDYIVVCKHCDKCQHTLKSLEKESSNYSQTDFIYQRMDWQIDPGIRYIKGSVSSHFISKTDQLSELEMDLHSGMEIDSIIQGEQTITYTHNSHKILMKLNTSLNEGDIDSIRIYYKGVPEYSGFGSFSTGLHGPSQVPVLWTLSEPYGALEWWPCKQSLVDKIDSIDILITCPEEYRTASIGLLQEEIVENGQRTMHWKHRHPIVTYLVAIAVTNYENYSDTLYLDDGRTIEILNYVYPEDLDEIKKRTGITVDIMKLFNELIGEYPFANEKYGHAQFGWGGGMEHQTMSFMGSFHFGLIAHELAHQWFGDYITLGSWQDIWLNEGFATYLTGVAHEFILEEKNWTNWKKAYKQRVLSRNDGSVFVYDTTSVSRIFNADLSYAKGGYLLHMLRWTIGDELFFQALQNYFADPAVANGFARSIQWQQHLELVADTSLTEFFDDWLYGEGYPIYSAMYSQDSNDSLVFKLTQNTTHSSVDFFQMNVPIRLYGDNGNDSVDFRLVHTQKNQEFILKPGFPVKEIAIDPDDWLICKTDQIVSAPVAKNQSNLNIYPNPTYRRLNLEFDSREEIKKIQLYNVLGSTVLNLKTDIRTIDLEALTSGTYFLIVETEKSIYKEMVIKR